MLEINKKSTKTKFSDLQIGDFFTLELSNSVFIKIGDTNTPSSDCYENSLIIKNPDGEIYSHLSAVDKSRIVIRLNFVSGIFEERE